MSLLVVGTVAFDSIETPHGKVQEETGGSATYFALAASRFTDVHLVGAVGDDFPKERLRLFDGRPVDLAGLEVVEGGRTFRWSGRYEGDMNAAETLDTQLNVLATFDPKLPPAAAEAPFIFLANGAPRVQLEVLRQAKSPRFVVADTMNFWIENEHDALLELLRKVDGLVLNDEECRLLTGESNLIRAGNRALEFGPKVVIVKKGEHGAFLFSTYLFHAMPAYPVTEVVDPTGAGDSFAGGLMGYLARTGRVSIPNLKRGMVYGTVAASYTVAEFGTASLHAATREDLDLRCLEFLNFVS